MKTLATKQSEVTRQWFVIDATDMVLGRLSTVAASLLKGKHKPSFAPYLDCGDHVVIINADKAVLTSDKADKKFAYRHSGYPGALRATVYRELMVDKPTFVVEKAIKGMLPKGPLGRQMGRKLKVYAGPVHPHAAQQVVEFDIPEARRASR
ncbi:MAG: 50S ribosomal protein L13 [Acidimicrobiales bacterium]|jgi:large subunit ribosomal protein L13